MIDFSLEAGGLRSQVHCKLRQVPLFIRAQDSRRHNLRLGKRDPSTALKVACATSAEGNERERSGKLCNVGRNGRNRTTGR